MLNPDYLEKFGKKMSVVLEIKKCEDFGGFYTTVRCYEMEGSVVRTYYYSNYTSVLGSDDINCIYDEFKGTFGDVRLFVYGLDYVENTPTLDDFNKKQQFDLKIEPLKHIFS